MGRKESNQSINQSIKLSQFPTNAQCTYWIMAYSAYFVRSTPPRVFSLSFDTLQVYYRHIEDVHEQIYDENIFDKFTAF